jgi:hypothetical protein
VKQENPKQDEITRAKEILAVHREYLMTKANVVGVGVGLKQVQERYTQSVALIVLVTRKVPKDDLAADDRIPEEIEGIPVDVQETGAIEALNRDL